MKRLATFVFAALFIVAAPAAAQQELLESCATVAIAYSPPPGPPPSGQRDNAEEQFRFLCGQVVNALTSVQPTVGIAFSGGAHTLGTFTTIGRRLGMFPRVAATARVNVALANGPNLLDGFTPTFGGDGEVAPMGTTRIPVGAFQGDVVVGLFNGLSFGPLPGGLGAVDLLGSLSFVPAVQVVTDAIGMEDHIINVGLGARVGILKQGLIMPGISVSGMYRTMLSDVGFGSIVAGDPAEFSTSLSTLSLRGGISKGLLMVNLAAGAGYDIYTSDVRFDFELECPAAQCGTPATIGTADGVSGQLKTAAWNVFGNVGLNLLLLNFIGEVGYQKATDVVDAAAFRDAGLPDQAPTAEALEGGRFFISIGARLTI